MTKEGIFCPPNSKSPLYKAQRLVVQQHGPQQKAQKANAALGLATLTFQPLDPDMQKFEIKKAISIAITNPKYNAINNAINNPKNNAINSSQNGKRRKLENWAKN